MKHTTIINHSTVALVLGFVLLFSSCKKDKMDIDLTLDKTTVEVFTDEQVTVQISSGSGDYSVSSSSETTATAEVSGEAITISGKAQGTATITITDGAGKSATVAVTVKTAIIDTTTPRFKWENTIELEVANGWGHTVLADRVVVTNLTEKKQYVLVWAGGYDMGDKTDATLRIVASGTTTEEVALSSLEVQRAENDVYSIVFSKDVQKGELVFTK